MKKLSQQGLLDDDKINEIMAEEKAKYTRLPFALCMDYGIHIEDWWTPKDAWDALLWKGKISSVKEECKKHATEIKRFEENKKFRENKSFEIPNVEKAYKFNRLDTKHHIRHVNELGFKNSKEYEREAVRFFNSNEGKLYYSVARKRFYRYDEKSSRLVISSDGIVHTFMKKDKNRFNQLEIQDELKEV
jgi:hypothetical protein